MNKKQLPKTIFVYAIITMLCLIFEFTKPYLSTHIDSTMFTLLFLFMRFTYICLGISAVIYGAVTVKKIKRKALYPILILSMASLIYIVPVSLGMISTDGKTVEQREILNNAEALEHRVIDLATEYKVIRLADLTPFEWDKVYFFQPYTSTKYVYEKVGYPWDSISETVSEGMMQIVFMKSDKVVCYVFGGVGYGEHFSLISEREELNFAEDPLFIVTRFPKGNPFEDYANGYASLSWFDDSLIKVDYDNSLPPNIVGRWDKREEGYGTLSFLITKEGIVDGYLGFSGTKEHDGGGGASFIGTYANGKAHCKTRSASLLRASNSANESNYEPIEFDIIFSNEQFTLTVDFSSKLDFKYIDGTKVDINSNIVVTKKE